jgi:DNA-binding SARP family transcriptional activator/Tfp pilus assembly protein PilF
MWFAILGPLLVHDGDEEIAVPAARQRVLLAALLVRAGRSVPADELAEVVWDGSPPAGSAATLRTYVKRLRRVLGPRVGARVVTRYPGYLLDAAEEEADLLRFTRLCRDGGAAVREAAWAQAWAVMGEALGLWRGAALADVPSQVLRRDESARLEQLRLQAAEWRIDAGLHMGRDSELVGELQSLAAEHPLRERFHAQLMLALYRSGRRADALAAYRHARRVLVEELATEPGTELRDLHQRMLTADPALKLSEPATSVRLSAVPRQLPAAVEQFTGRGDELAELTAQLRPAGRTPRTMVISAIGGTAGVGKSALAVHWAHQAAERFPDGQLYVNLRGYDPGQPVPPGDALAGFLRALGVPGPDVPSETDERAARFRSLLAGRQILVLLDNAGSVEQVRPLLPGTPGCAVLVTSRDALAGLVARDGARRLDLDLLPLADAVSLLRALIGARVDRDPKAAAALTAQCCRLPLALRVAAELAAARPAVPLADLAGELADQHQRLDLLDAGGDPATAIRAVFSWSYRHLEPDTARAFRLAGLHPGPDLDPFAAAALTGTSLPRVGRLLDQLALANLIHLTGPGRCGMHDLLRAYARELAAAEQEEEQRAALTRLFGYYLHTAAAAMDALFPAEQQHRPRIPASAGPAPMMTGTAAALAWLDAERENLVSVAVHAAEHQWPGHATRLASTLFRYLETGGHHREAVTIHSYARRAARDTGDRAAEAIALTNLGLVDLRQGSYRQATGYLREALALYREAGDRSGEARTRHDIGIADFEQGRYREAAGHFQEALTIQRGLGDRVSEARTLNSLGLVDTRLGRYRQAADNLQRALALCRDVGNSAVAAYAALNLGDVDLRQGHCRKATSHFQQALALFRETGDRTGEAYALTGLGDAVPRPEQPSAGYHEQALALFRGTGDRSGEAEALNGLGKVFLVTGQDDQARAQHAAALALASEIGSKYQQARSHEGLARAYDACGNPGYARHHWQKALTLYTDLGVPEALQVHTQLAAAVNETEPAIAERSLT